MSETPDNEAGRGTEELMAALCDGQDVPTEIYNKCYSAVYELLRFDAKPDYAKIIAEDDATLAKMRSGSEWRTVICGLTIVGKLLRGEDVTLESFKVNLIPDDVLHRRAAQPAGNQLEREVREVTRAIEKELKETNMADMPYTELDVVERHYINFIRQREAAPTDAAPQCKHIKLVRRDDLYGFTTYDIEGFRPTSFSENDWIPVARVYTTRMDGEAAFEGMKKRPDLCSECRRARAAEAKEPT